ncbi:ArsR/SmtB family transcription factor [Cumulibacter manganitolerans]|uniref:ArsR/SmtB family transcription factor n=1 Tax=Cumulibacter manganitolerans TaxID=1884992 RepID=UPI001295B3F5|nr:metalloregulator ArsR/SmtB family transcription factor [Cumulibacter manganitolerans]
MVGSGACIAEHVAGTGFQVTWPLLVCAEESARIADTFALLADPGRVRVVFALLDAGETLLCDVAEMVEMSSSALSHALRLLRTAGLVTNRRDGRMVHYRLADSHVRLLLDITREHLGHTAGARGV